MNHQQNLFLSDYIVTGNATASAIKAGYSKKTAYSQGQRLLKNVEIKKGIKMHQEAVSKDAGVKMAEVVSEIQTIAFSKDPSNIRLKALDMLMKHLGGYENDLKIIQNLSEDQIDTIVNKLMQNIS